MPTTDILDHIIPPLKQIFHTSNSIRITGPSSATAFLAGTLCNTFNTTIVHICDGPQTLDTAHRDICTLLPANMNRPLYYPPLESYNTDNPCADPEITGHRLNTLQTLLHANNIPDKQIIIATSVQALMQRVPSHDFLAANSSKFSIGDSFDMNALNQLFLRLNYRFTHKVFNKCEISVHGGIVDIWPPSEPWPLRIELFGTDIESIRTFDPAEQRSLNKKESILIMPADNMLNKKGQTDQLLAYLPQDTIFIWSDRESINEYAATCQNTAKETDLKKITLSYKKILSAISGNSRYRQIISGSLDDSTADAGDCIWDFAPVPAALALPGTRTLPDAMRSRRSKLIEQLKEQSQQGRKVVICLNTPGSMDHFKKNHGIPDTGTNRTNQQHAPYPLLLQGFLSKGFSCDALNLTFVSESDLYGYHKKLDQSYHPLQSPVAQPASSGERLNDLTGIEPGDLVVHSEYGLGRYLGVFEINFNETLQEVLSIEYADNTKLHVPVAHVHLLSRYVGAQKQNIRLHRLDGTRWRKEKQQASEAIADLASELLEVQAHRDLLKGHKFKSDTAWQTEFEASFPYHETIDQRSTIATVKQDMESEHPMDRLICGDAGYGKTEVAMRAAFKTVMEGKQVAVLVPTTVLALQHYQTFSDRMAPYPVRIEMLSRFRDHKGRNNTMTAMSEGKVDIVIGTHALLQPSIKFKDLGLVIIDEEQRFGVAHKEHLKHIRKLVDVLTLTATPIPRTLYMSMTGARDISLIQTPPRERMAIKTIVTKNTDDIIREAIIRELNREGQVFYLHNRVTTIENARKRLENIVPEAKIRIGHGQMTSAELSETISDFSDGEFDVLLCTTIVESGMDIPRANTILIDRADRFGIADLYQLRGRVGRSSRQAYAYLLLPSHGSIESDARKRIAAIRKYSGLSTGFSLALRDLEIRGSGNLLGAQQSGHIAAVGFSLYCQLLKQTVARLKGVPLPPIIDVPIKLDFISYSANQFDANSSAVIPYEYIEDESLRIEVYRKIAGTTSLQELTTLHEEITDQYGTIPQSLRRLLKIYELRVIAAGRRITSIEVKSGKLILQKGNDYIKHGDRFPRLTKKGTDERVEEITDIVKSL